uniref:2-oxoglutarate-dependent dioxygenase GA 2-oxidase n=1 Tax=Jasminum sambac TaxID=660624 RepID=A0A977R5A4_9LAMI|nr:2-oxoglutarate-dependent dioxygenase GA 2-oxidase [Jasminum sambac]
MGEVDPAFVQAVEHQPKLNIIEAEGIPVIDLSPLNSTDNDAELSSLVSEIGDACKNWGFFQVINHGVPLKQREKIESASRKFFALSKEEKKKVSRDDVNPMGYYDTEHTKNVRDWKEVFDLTFKKPTTSESGENELNLLMNQWPQDLPELREACEEYAEEMIKLAYKLLELIALSLGLPRTRLNGFLTDHGSFLRLNRYPPCPAPHLVLGVGRHKDPNSFTILAQDDVGGLEVKRKIDGEWVLVKPTPSAYIINIGDIIQVWSNDKYESVEHRVMVNVDKERISIPFFVNPPTSTWIEPLDELIDEPNPARYKAYNYGEFLAARARSNYEKLDVENIQISHYRI